MTEPSTRIVERNGLIGNGQGVEQCLAGSGFETAQDGFDFGKEQFDGIEVGRVGGQELDGTPDRFNRGVGNRGMMDGQIISDHNLPRLQGGDQHLSDVHFKGALIHRAFKRPRGFTPSQVSAAMKVVFLPRRRGTDSMARWS